MNWYLVKIIFRIISGNGKHTPQFEEQLRLISATSSRQAIEKANVLALNEEETFLNDAQELVQWKLIAVTDIYFLETGTDGATLFSKIYEEENPATYIHSAKLRSEDLMKNFAELIHQ